LNNQPPKYEDILLSLTRLWKESFRDVMIFTIIEEILSNNCGITKNIMPTHFSSLFCHDILLMVAPSLRAVAGNVRRARTYLWQSVNFTSYRKSIWKTRC